jgi:hypothetical protein
MMDYFFYILTCKMHLTSNIPVVVITGGIIYAISVDL